jgi:hypothetical protein
MNFGHIFGNTERYREQVVYRRLISYGPAALVTTVSVLLAGRLWRLISRYAVNVFFWDEWDLKDLTLFQRNSLWRMFSWQHGWHRLGMGALVEKFVDPAFHWNSRIESFILGGILAVAAICALWLKTRLAGRLSISDVVIPAIFFSPAQWETLYMTPIFSQGPLPFLLIVLYCLAWTCERSALRYPVVLLINFVTIYTGFGLFIGAVTPVLLGLDYWSQLPSKRLPTTSFIAALLISVASLGSFFHGYIFRSGVSCFSHFQSSAGSYVAFMALLASNFFALKGSGSFPRVVGGTVLIAVLISLICAVWRLLRRTDTSTSQPDRTRRLVVIALAAVSLASCAIIAYIRLCAGLDAASAPRYAVYVQIGVLGLYFHLLGVRRSWNRRWLQSLLVVPVLVASRHADKRGMAHFRDSKERWKQCYFQIEDIKQCNEITGFVICPPGEQHHLDEKLQYLKKTKQNLYLDQQEP